VSTSCTLSCICFAHRWLWWYHFDNCTTTDSNLLESVQTAAAKIIPGCLKTTSYEIILKDLGLTPLFIRRQFHILKAFRAILFRPCPSFLSTLAPKFFKNLSDYSSRFLTNVQLPSCKTHSLHNSFFHKGSKLWNSLPTYLHNLSSRQFCSKVFDLFLTKKTNAWHLHVCNTNATAILCMLRLGHSKLNIDGRYNQICQCGAFKTKVHMFLECPFTCASRRMLFTNLSKILAKENVFSYTGFAALNPAELIEIVLFGHPKLSKSPSLRLFRQTCLFLSRNTPF